MSFIGWMMNLFDLVRFFTLQFHFQQHFVKNEKNKDPKVV